ncbi:hypothetical protein B0H17DRAFT_1138972 [Mycena rosella]|uniref:Uncharacterized protein n=1 Tax=Mycena rosella TaxID=1033263 RepID=A0AAD7D8U5_MYCRO|nr:hypothetical protein B0H17DRAFT_1138972 [Mycena rosella]
MYDYGDDGDLDCYQAMHSAHPKGLHLTQPWAARSKLIGNLPLSLKLLQLAAKFLRTFDSALVRDLTIFVRDATGVEEGVAKKKKKSGEVAVHLFSSRRPPPTTGTKTFSSTIRLFLSFFRILCIMPVFSKPVSSLAKPQLISAAQTFNLDSTGNVATLRGLIRGYIVANKAAVMGNPDHACLFPRKEREEWDARSGSPSSWHGIGSDRSRRSTPDSDQADQATPAPPDDPPAHEDAPDAGDTLNDHDVRTHLLQSMNPAALSQALQLMFGQDNTHWFASQFGHRVPS